MQYGPRIKELRTLQEAGKNVPALDRREEIDLGYDDWIWDGYAALVKGRTWFMGQPQAIALSDILAYSDLVGLNREDTGSMLKFTRQLDDVYFEFLKGKAPKQNGGTGSSNRRSRRGKRR